MISASNLQLSFIAIAIANMPKKAGPSLLCEWMVGTSIQSALGPPPKAPKPKPRPKKRDLIKLHVATDEESGEDTLTITYPRSERLDQSKETPAAAPEPVTPEPESEPEVVEVVKKVRFEKETASATAAIPRKSAMKKKTLVTFCEEEETSDSGGDATSTSASSGEATPEASSSNESSAADTSSGGETSSDESSKSSKASRSRKYPKSRKAEKPVQDSDSEADSDPHPTCKCKECTTERKKRVQESVCEKKRCKKNEKAVSAKKAKPETETESETSASEAESSADEKPPPSKKAKENKKGKNKVEISDTEGETSESAKEASESEDVPKKSQEKTKNKNEKGEKKVDSSKNEGETEAEEAKKDSKKGKEAEAKSEASKGKDKENEDSKKPTAEGTPLPYDTKYYPDGHPYSHARPPNLIAPIRAEVMHTERVVETKDDPLPNAYYDALHNVVRVYHGSVYGQNGRHMFANREGISGHPQHHDMSHQMQNPYYSSYNNVMPFGPPPPPPPPLPPPPAPQQQFPLHGYEHVPITQGMPMPGWNAMVPPPGYPPYNYYGGPMPPPWYEQQLNKQARGALDVNGTSDGKGGKNKSQEPDNNVMPEVTKVCILSTLSCSSRKY